MTDVRLARRSAMVDLDGTLVRVRRGRTMAHGDHPIVAENPELWGPRPLEFDLPYDRPAAAPARPRERDAKADWCEYAQAVLGVHEDEVADITKSGAIALVDGIEAGALRLDDDGRVIDPAGAEG